MKAIALNLSQSINPSEWFTETEIEIPTPSTRDLLVQVKAISVNPVDYKVRASLPMQHPSKISGWDASGIVEIESQTIFLEK
ncbi:MDR/zinc-dependent alcohol dehydrogenase-like family protein [Prochlorothrix hollandica]|uniref:Uncharacterized protein n=1 Tax=Prochlorothrix hollandica PCC 9006 = CALU 1027 TaxID=317619 RepID=A0A0M2PUW8_PROHO|nr:hypothetical protein [Prochlorothrix hollandica]KKI98433.1 hypothetical protein PROH_18425 [Prochlorothrix hollandica PCC 9006 = CALU 1027]